MYDQAAAATPHTFYLVMQAQAEQLAQAADCAVRATRLRVELAAAREAASTAAAAAEHLRTDGESASRRAALAKEAGDSKAASRFHEQAMSLTAQAGQERRAAEMQAQQADK